MSLKTSIAYVGVLSALIGLSGCSSTIHKTSTLGAHKVLSIDAKQRVVISGYRDEQAVVCAEPSPDAMVARASYATSSLKTPKGTEASGAAGSNETVSSIGVQTQTIQLLRDGYYRICEAYLNGVVGEEEYKIVVNGIDEFMLVLVAIEALGGVVKAPDIIISPTGKAEINADGSSSAEAKSGATVLKIEDIKEAFKTINVDTAGLSKEQSTAITEIVKAYMEHKIDILYKLNTTKGN